MAIAPLGYPLSPFDFPPDSGVVDYVNDLVMLMLSIPNITAMTGQRIYGELLPREDFRNLWSDPKNVQPTIVVREINGQPFDDSGPLVNVNYEVRCYGKDPIETRVLNANLRTQLHDQYGLTNPYGRKFRYIKLASAGNGGADEDNWEFFLSNWNASLFFS